MNADQRPNLITVIGVTTLISGIVNLFWGLVASMTAVGTFVGVICVPITILPTVLGVFEIIYGAKILTNPPQPIKPSNPIAVFEILCILVGNIFSAVVGILSLIFYNDLTVKEYFAGINATQTAPLAPQLPVAPVPVDPTPEPTLPEPAQDDIPRPKHPRKLA